MEGVVDGHAEYDKNEVGTDVKNSEVKQRMKEHKLRMRRNQKERKQQELQGVLDKVAGKIDGKAVEDFTFSSLYKFIPKLGALLSLAEHATLEHVSELLIEENKSSEELVRTEFWARIPPVCTPDQSTLDNRIATDAVLKGEAARQRKYLRKLEMKLKSGDITEEKMEEMLNNFGRKNSSKQNGEGEETVESFPLLNINRGLRKKQQVENFASIFNLFGEKKVVVDFGCGSGNLCLSLASFYTNTKFVFVDQNMESLNLLTKRAEAGGLRNVIIMQYSFNFDNLADFGTFFAKQGLCREEKFDLGIGLHSCGRFTDMVMEVCRLNQADCLVSPCCNGKMDKDYQQDVHNSGRDLQQELYPRSTFFNDLISREEYFAVSRAADDLGNYQAKCAIEYDRARWAEEKGYEVWLFKMDPVSASPKHHVLYCKH